MLLICLVAKRTVKSVALFSGLACGLAGFDQVSGLEGVACCANPPATLPVEKCRLPA
jgi:hypothetical protein